MQVEMEEKAWKVVRQPAVTAGWRRAGDYEVQAPDGGLHFISADGDRRFTPLDTAELPTGVELKTLPLEKLVAFFRRSAAI